MLYDLTIEPLLSQLRQGLTGLTFGENTVSLPAYADDVAVFIIGQNDIQILEQKLTIDEEASCAVVKM